MLSFDWNARPSIEELSNFAQVYLVKNSIINNNQLYLKHLKKCWSILKLRVCSIMFLNGLKLLYNFIKHYTVLSENIGNNFIKVHLFLG